MLVFIIALKSAKVSSSWDHVSRLARRTLASVCAQDSPSFRVVVACHEIPERGWKDDRVEFLSVDHAPPPPEPAAMRNDRWRKYHAALEHARTYAPSHVMFVDADDCVSNRLAGFVARHSEADGWYLRSGYFYSERQSRVYLERWRFHKWCGTSNIIRPEHCDLLQHPGGRLKVPHGQMAEVLRDRGKGFRPLPFRGAVYCVSHGENFRDYEPVLWPSRPVHHAIRRVVNHRACTPALEREYGLYPVAPRTGGY